MTKDEIKKALKAKGVRPVDLARKAMVTRSMVSHVMSGSHPSSPVRGLIIETLGKKPSEIWPPKC
ncbi:helix-turn-helix domain-containing protein [Desulfoluna butyratoxydans]|uniref:Cro/c1-type helix-turn-helix domain n=1 Tax=Desulfoluna butyratoxydans TaxID=231438 RepID=A0A4U8YSL3_9BACT|nr:helix-turn-helix domain-containing protein [Desulfoluna butyratoxydans]VFQ47375.1 cro/c1-type helix-turn-helix domain [Desulfoluna butyratoxydans]